MFTKIIELYAVETYNYHHRTRTTFKTNEFGTWSWYSEFIFYLLNMLNLHNAYQLQLIHSTRHGTSTHFTTLP